VRIHNYANWQTSYCSRGTPGNLEQVEIDTAHFKGNFPESCELHALFSDHDIDWQTQRDDELSWTSILPRTKLGPHRQHFFQLENVEGKTFTHARLTIYPDGGIKRVRLIGQRISLSIASTEAAVTIEDTQAAAISATATALQTTQQTTIPVLPLTPEAFVPFGQVIQAYSDHSAAPKGTTVLRRKGPKSLLQMLVLQASSTKSLYLPPPIRLARELPLAYQFIDANL